MIAIPAMLAVLLVGSGCSKGSGRMPPGLLASHEAGEKGRELFMENCAICHGENGDGHGPRSVGMTPPPANLTIPPWSDSAVAPSIYQAVHDGVAGTAMPSWRALDGRQIWDLVAYVHSLGNPEETPQTRGRTR